jgi:hypothetical protein|tara:strand:- start:332 stop:748 length:417 start_codon:yes stop_codon:yes gene_type:complete
MKEEEKADQRKNPLKKIKETIEDKEEQLAFISVIVRLVVVGWSGFIVSLNYISIPGYTNEPKDITFPASLLTGALASFGLEGAKKRGDGTFKKEDKPLNKKEVEQLLATQSGNYQTIRIETPIKILGAEVVDKKEDKK